MQGPGIAVATVLSSMNGARLASLIGDRVLATLTYLNNGPPSDDHLRNVALSLYAQDAEASVRDTRIREQLVSALSIGKAQELLRRLELPVSGDVYARLRCFEFGRQRLRDEALLSFFGVVPNPTAPLTMKPSSSELAPEYGLFDYQRDVVRRASAALSQHPHKTLLHMPTGSGKTRTAMHLIARHLTEHGPTLICWLASSSELLDQAAEEIERSWGFLGDRPISVFRFWGDHNLELRAVRDGVLVTGFAKLHAAYSRNQNEVISLGDRASLVVVDEAHQAIAPTYRTVIETIHSKRPGNALIGLSATPGRTWNEPTEDRRLADFFGGRKITLEVPGFPDPIAYLVAEGYLARPIFQTLDIETTGPMRDVCSRLCGDSEIPSEVLEALGRDAERNYQITIAIEDLLRRHERIIVFASSVENANILSSILFARGHNAKVITAETPRPRRERYIAQFRRRTGKPMVLCNYGVLTTGFDAPVTSAAVIARPTRSLVLYSQMVGRAIRGPRANGNETAEVLTIVDTGLPGFGSVVDAFNNWEDVWDER